MAPLPEPRPDADCSPMRACSCTTVVRRLDPVRPLHDSEARLAGAHRERSGRNL